METSKPFHISRFNWYFRFDISSTTLSLASDSCRCHGCCNMTRYKLSLGTRTIWEFRYEDIKNHFRTPYAIDQSF